MKPYAIFNFEKLPEMETRYILQEHFGNEIENFPATWRQKTHPYLGKKYIVFRNAYEKHLKKRFTHTLLLEANRIVTGFNFDPAFPLLSWGEYQDNAILIEFSEDFTDLTLLFFRGMKNESYTIFKKGIVGEIEELLDDKGA